jgi:predicted amidophosphoribosyltransferase
MVKYCTKCGKENPDISNFCESCGENINKEKYHENHLNEFDHQINTRSYDNIECPYCGASMPLIPSKNIKCIYCGMSIREDESKHNTAIIMGYLVALFTGLGIIPAIYLLTRDNQRAKTHGIIILIIFLLYVVWFIYTISFLFNY